MVAKIFYLTLFILCGCDGIIANHYAMRGNEPIDGTFGNSRFDSDDVMYTQGNLEHLNDRKKRNNNLYFASAKKYLEINHQIAHEYVDNYQKFLKVDAQELEHGIKTEQYGVKGGDILRKMESGNAVKQPIKGNIEAIQVLKDEKNKIAFPDYMSEYLDEYSKKDYTASQNAIMDAEYAPNYAGVYNTSSRDDYVSYYYNMNNKPSNGYDRYKEKFLE